MAATLRHLTDLEVIEMIKGGAKFNGKIYKVRAAGAAGKRGLMYSTVFVDGIQYFIKGDESAFVNASVSNNSRIYNTGYGYHGTSVDAARGFDGIE